MNRFVAFFVISFLVHIVVGAILLSRSGILGGKGTEDAELSQVVEEEKVKEIVKESVIEQKKAMPPKKEEIKQPILKKIKKPAVNKRPIPVKKKVKKEETKEIKSSVEKAQIKTEKPDKKSEITSSEQEEKLKEKKLEEGKPEEKKVSSEGLEEDASELMEEDKTGKATEDKLREEDKKISSEGLEEDASELMEEDKTGKTKEEKQEEKKSPPSPKPVDSSNEKPSIKELKTARNHSQLKQIEGNPVPVYPTEALKKKWEGRVNVIYYVNSGGFVEKIQLEKSTGHSVLDNTALRTLSRYRYYPGQEGWVRHPVEFFLEVDKEVKEIAPLGVSE